MNGVTGRMGMHQHLERSILAIIAQGGVKISDSESIIPQPLLLGRNPDKLENLARDHGNLPWTTDLESALANPDYSIYFDA
jgi:predicted dehydrogenase